MFPSIPEVVAATHNADLGSSRGGGALQADLFYRLNVVNIRVPALRERGSRGCARSGGAPSVQTCRKGRQLRDFGEEALLAMRPTNGPAMSGRAHQQGARATIMAEGELITPQDLGLQGGSVSR